MYVVSQIRFALNRSFELGCAAAVQILRRDRYQVCRQAKTASFQYGTDKQGRQKAAVLLCENSRKRSAIRLWDTPAPKA